MFDKQRITDNGTTGDLLVSGFSDGESYFVQLGFSVPIELVEEFKEKHGNGKFLLYLVEAVVEEKRLEQNEATKKNLQEALKISASRDVMVKK